MLHTCGLPHAYSWVRRGSKTHMKISQGLPPNNKDTASTTDASLHVRVVSHRTSELTKRRLEHTILRHRRFSSLGAYFWELCLARQAHRTIIDAMQSSMHAAPPSHRLGFYGASSLTPSPLSSSCRCLCQGHLLTTKAAASATACLASRQGPTGLIVGVLHKSRLLTTLNAMRRSTLVASLRHCLGFRSSPSHLTRVVATFRPCLHQGHKASHQDCSYFALGWGISVHRG